MKLIVNNNYYNNLKKKESDSCFNWTLQTIQSVLMLTLYKAIVYAQISVSQIFSDYSSKTGLLVRG